MSKLRHQDIRPFKPAGEVSAQAPAIVLSNPRYPHNVGAVVRGASCYGIKQVWVSGSRVAEQVWASKRIPREERMKGFADVDIVLDDDPFKHFDRGVTPVAVELLQGSENLLTFEHPPNPLYLFGPEDGSVPAHWRKFCHRRVFIPTRHYLNLGVAVSTLLYDRLFKAYQRGQVDALPLEDCLNEDRGRLNGWPIEDDPQFKER